jgi:hypothetical protein
MKILLVILGAVGVLLGGLWFVQGLGIVTIPPILCVAECEPLEGQSIPWAIIGFIVLVAGLFGLWRGLRRPGGPQSRA